MAEAAREAWKYGDAQASTCARRLRPITASDMENIIVGEGIDGLLGYLVRLLVAPGDPVVTSDGAYPTFNYHVRASAARCTRCPTGDHEDPTP